ncbi:MAG TPA: EamA family transporter [Dongiaceae bacterium]|nr:EamA family transporter [Dongiaceae bacterium]
MLTVLLLFILICGSTGGEVAIAQGAKTTGEPERMRPREILIFLGRAICSGWFWLGIPLMALSFFALLILLSWHPLSFVIPISALSYVVGALGAKYLLGEDVNTARWAGVILVCAGVALVAAG